MEKPLKKLNWIIFSVILAILLLSGIHTFLHLNSKNNEKKTIISYKAKEELLNKLSSALSEMKMFDNSKLAALLSEIVFGRDFLIDENDEKILENINKINFDHHLKIVFFRKLEFEKFTSLLDLNYPVNTILYTDEIHDKFIESNLLIPLKNYDTDRKNNVIAGLIINRRSEELKTEYEHFHYTSTLNTVLLFLSVNFIFIITGILLRIYLKKIINRADKLTFEKNSKMYLDVLEKLPYLVIRINSNGEYLYCNKRFSEITGFDNKSNLLNKLNFYETGYTVGNNSFNLFDKFENLPDFFEKQIKTSNNSEITVAWHLIDEPWYHNGLKCFTLIGEDITIKTKLFTDLKESEELYRSLFNNKHMPMLILNPDTGGIVDANLAAVSFYGYSHEEFREINIRNINTEPEIVKQKMNASLNLQQNYFEFKHRLKSGEVKDVQVFAGPIKIKDKILLYSLINDITSKKLIEHELEKSRIRLQNLFDNMIEGFAYFKMEINTNGQAVDYTYIDVNESFEKIMNVKKKNIVNKRFTEVFPELKQLHKKWLTYFNDVLQTNSNIVFDDFSEELDLGFKISVYPAKRNHIVMVFNEITEQMKINNALKEWVVRQNLTGSSFLNQISISFANILKADYIIIGKLSKDKSTIHTISICAQNQIVDNITYSLEGTPCKNILNKSTVIVENSVTSHYPEDFLLQQMGIEAYIGTPLLNSQNEVIGNLLALFRAELKNPSFAKNMLSLFSPRIAGEIERNELIEELEKSKKQLELKVEERTLQLKESEEVFRKLAENSNDTVMRFNKNLEHIYVNPVVEELTGMRVQDFIGKTHKQMNFPNYLIEIWEDTLEKSLHNKKEYRIEFQLPNGIWIDWFVIPELNAQGEVETLYGYGRDITTHKTMEKQISDALIREKELNELKSRFISTTSHEFRTPLTAIMSSAELIQLFSDEWTKQLKDEHINRIISSVEYLTNLLEDILFISKADSGKIKYEPARTDLYQLFEIILSNVKSFEKKNHETVFEYNISRKIFKLDAKIIRQAVTNLLTNAYKYSPDGGKVKLTCWIEEDYLKISVSDDGIGLNKEDLLHLFEPFYRAKSVHNIPGTGLGLSIVKKAVEAHKGFIKCENKQPKGLIFSISFPLEFE